MNKKKNKIRKTKLKKGYAVISLERFMARKENKPIIDENSLQELEDRYLIWQHDKHKKKGVLFSLDQEIKYLEATGREKERLNQAKRKKEEAARKEAETDNLNDDNNIIEGTYREIESDTDTDSSEEGIKVTDVTSESSSLETDNVTAEINNNQP